ncbi:MAG: ribonuclease HI [Desulfobacterales bacterium]|nr:ribonuclease HI [Desulfobacterales bacterium]
MMFKGHKVWLRVDADQRPVRENNKVLIKYQLDHDYEYWVRENAVQPIDSESLSSKKRKTRTKKSDRKTAPHKSAQDAKESVLPGTLRGAGPSGPEAIVVYTDGASSGNPGPAGIGIVLRFGSRQKEISRHIGVATNNIAELTAIKTALEAIRTTETPVRLHTDSQYCYGLLALGWKARQNEALVAATKRLMKKFTNLRILKIQGHAGIADNERADQLARTAVNKGPNS